MIKFEITQQVFLKKLYRVFIKRPYYYFKSSIKTVWNKSGTKKECYICNNSFRHYTKLGNGFKGLPVFFKHLQLVGSDIDNYFCVCCGAIDRERHIFMYFDKLSLWDKFKNARILHFAPEIPLSHKIESFFPLEYIKCDLSPKENWEKIDITNITSEDNYYDVLICNHVLEHVPDYLLALKEISRVVKKGGLIIIQTPFSELLYKHFEDPNINTDELRLSFYGQEDHVRIFSKRQFINELSQHFNVRIIKNQSLFSEAECIKFGVNKIEDLLLVINDKS